MFIHRHFKVRKLLQASNLPQTVEHFASTYPVRQSDLAGKILKTNPFSRTSVSSSYFSNAITPNSVKLRSESNNLAIADGNL